VYDAGLRQLAVANAGAPHPILLRNREVREIKIEGTPLGMFPDSEYETETLGLHPEDLVLFASDGILESMNAARETFGFGRLAQVLRNLAPGDSAEQVSTAILKATDKFSGNQSESHDDRTAIILRIH